MPETFWGTSVSNFVVFRFSKVLSEQSEGSSCSKRFEVAAFGQAVGLLSEFAWSLVGNTTVAQLEAISSK